MRSKDGALSGKYFVRVFYYNKHFSYYFIYFYVNVFYITKTVFYHGDRDININQGFNLKVIHL